MVEPPTEEPIHRGRLVPRTDAVINKMHEMFEQVRNLRPVHVSQPAFADGQLC